MRGDQVIDPAFGATLPAGAAEYGAITWTSKPADAVGAGTTDAEARR